MASSLNKRHQARNEQALQELMRSVPGNDRCADCQSANPGWASWSLGIFLCMRCGSLHRKLGTHVSKVKSLSMDSWTVDQVDVMRKNGNVKSNQKYNPRNVKPPVPLDADEIDSAMERFIRQKYEQQKYVEGATSPTAATPSSPIPRDTYGGNRSGSPPTPPPKTPPKSGKRFGFFGKKKDKSVAVPERKSSSSGAPGKVVGAAFGVRDEGIEWKLVTLREMGFPDDSRNSTVLKDVNGDLERAVESLVRLGEGSAAARRTAQSSQEASRRNTPAPTSAKKEMAAAFGASVGAGDAAAARPADPASSDFWDAIAPASAPAHPPQSFEAQFGNMQLAQSQHPQQQQQQQQQQSNPLFPNATGGHPSYLDQSQSHIFNLTQSVPQLPPQPGHNPYAAAGAAQHAAHNPFMNAGIPQAPHTANPFLQGQATAAAANPFLVQQATGMPMQYSGQNPYEQQQLAQQQQQQAYQQQQQAQHQQQQVQQQQVQQQQQQQQQPSFNIRDQMLQQQPLQQPHLQQAQTWPVQNNMNAAQQQFAPQQFAQQPPQQQQQQQQPQAYGYQPTMPAYMQAHPTGMGRLDKSSILALYGQSQAAPQASPTGQGSPLAHGESAYGATMASSASPAAVQSPAAAAAASGAVSQASPPFASPQRSATMPLSGTKNPFKNMSPTQATVPGAGGGSMMGGDASGRHSPDAFASLSARYVR